MKFEYHDGGRSIAGYKGSTSDCVVRAIAIITELPYKDVYDLVNEFGNKEYKTKTRGEKSTSRSGVYKPTIKQIMKYLGFEWTPTMSIGSGCQVHLKESELPKGKIIVSLSKHICAVIDGVIYDTYDPSRNETRCVYGYWSKA